MEGSRKRFERLENGESYDFGWNFFTVTSKRTKTTEGKFSMYVDAVAKKVGPSSYCENNQFIDWNFTDRYGKDSVKLPEIYEKLQ